MEGVEKTIILFLKVGEEWSGNLVWGSFFFNPFIHHEFFSFEYVLADLE